MATVMTGTSLITKLKAELGLTLSPLVEKAYAGKLQAVIDANPTATDDQLDELLVTALTKLSIIRAKMVESFDANDSGKIDTRDELSTVRTSLDSVVDAAQADATSTVGQRIDLTVGADNKTGTAFQDTFVARVVQNLLGEQTNQLATGDILNGGANDFDTLTADVQQASALNQGPASAIKPETVDIEIAEFTALANNSTPVVGAADIVKINAKDMLGLDLVSSDDSDASLVIENLTTLTDTGVYAEKRTTDAVTIRMDHSGNDAALDFESDLTVLFDNDYLLANATDTTTLELRMVNAYSLRESSLPVVGFESVSFSVGGQLVTTEITAAIRSLTGQAAYNAIVDAIKAQLTAQGISNVEVTLQPQRTAVFTDDVGSYVQNDIAGFYSPILVKSVGSGQKLERGVTDTDNSTINANFLNTQTPNGTLEVNPVTSNIQLEKVGRGAEGGDLTVGGMATDLNNVWDYSTSAIKEGVERFNVTVSGDASQFSSLASLQSTNNTLAIVNVASAANSAADLIIGNHNTNAAVNNVVLGSDDDMTTATNGALKDVRVFNASSFANDVSLNAHISDESVAKYMNRTDTAGVATNDDANFEYSFGEGNDLLNLNISKTNLVQSGTTNREDFNLAIAMGNGNDTVETQIGDGTGVTADAWYINSNIEKNLSIDAGAGNDSVSTFGAGTWTVSLGAGNDVIYSDNSGNQRNAAVDHTTDAEDVVDRNYNEGRAVWVLNTDDQVTAGADAQRNIGNLESDSVESNAFYKSTVTVNLCGLTATATINEYAANDYALNNAIKAAIQNNNVLSKLIVAEDGPSGTLVIRSLTDGVFNSADFGVNVTAPTTLSMTPDQITGFNTANKLIGAAAVTDQAGALAKINADIAAWVARTDYDTAMANDGAVELVGAASTAATASTIYDGTGEDVIVLSTSGLATETVFLTADDQRDVVYNVHNAVIRGLSRKLAADGVTVVSQDEVVLTDGTHYTYSQLKAGNLLRADGSLVVTNGTLGASGFTTVDLGSAPVTASATTAEAFVYDFKMVGGRATKAGDGEVTITGFDVTKDKLVFNDVGTGTVYTEAQFKVLPGVVIAENPFGAGNTTIYFDADAGILGGVTLAGVVDAALANIVVETTA